MTSRYHSFKTSDELAGKQKRKIKCDFLDAPCLMVDGNWQRSDRTFDSINYELHTEN